MFGEIKQYILAPTDIYHENHPLHHLVLSELDDWDDAAKAYENDCLENSLLPASH